MSEQRKLWAVVPVGPFAQAKRRLMPCLAPHERAACARAMLADVLSALERSSSLAGIIVVTGDAGATAMAEAAGALVLPDLENAGISAAAEMAARHLVREGRGGMLLIPADVPLVTSEDIDAIVSAHRAAPSVTLVPASVDGGTNALACSPPDAIGFRFGADSFRLHQKAARERGIAATVLELARVGRDIDRPEDIAAFLARPSATRSYACLSANGIAQRLSRTGAPKQELGVDRVAQ
jgi:2-phospho-L-lactate guanylyltransferase